VSAFDDILIGGLAVNFGVHGQSVAYFSHAAQATLSVSAIVGAEEIVNVEEPAGAWIRRRQRTLAVEIGSADGQVPDPREKDYFTVADEKWTIVETRMSGNGFAELLATRPERAVHAGRQLPR